LSSILFKSITIVDESFSQKSNMFVGISDNKIDYIGSAYKAGYEREYDGTNKCLIPGFVNAHAHSPMALLRGYAENMALNDWLFKKIFPFEATLSEEDVYYSTLLSFAEMISFGCVSTTDMYYKGESMAKAVLESGVKSNISLAATVFNAEALKMEYKELLSSYKNYNDRLKVEISVHAPYTSTPEIVQEFSELAVMNGCNMHIHLSETLQENIECKEKYGCTPSEYFEKNGAFRVPTTAAHCVYLEDSDVEILRKHGVTVATCPTSNLKLASGVCDVQRLLDNGINVAIGTDSVASNNNLDMFGEMKLFALLPKGIKKDPTLITPAQCLYAASRAGALSQGRTDCGVVAVGNRADLAVIDLDRAHLTPVHEVLNTLVYSAIGSDIVLTMADGKILYENGEFLTIDIEKIKAYANKRIKV
jgi:5-methylthioadenosine/S-adenosylhomocysteine deaminase